MSGVQTVDGQSSFAFVKGELQEEDHFGRDTLGLCWAKEIARSLLDGLAVWLPGDFVIKGFLKIILDDVNDVDEDLRSG